MICTAGGWNAPVEHDGRHDAAVDVIDVVDHHIFVDDLLLLLLLFTAAAAPHRSVNGQHFHLRIQTRRHRHRRPWSRNPHYANFSRLTPIGARGPHEPHWPARSSVARGPQSEKIFMNFFELIQTNWMFDDDVVFGWRKATKRIVADAIQRH